jgi:anti-anti-sigma factor
VEHAVLDISGELDFSSVDDAFEAVTQLPHHIVSIDLAGLDFVDGAGARAIERIRRTRHASHGELPAIIGASPSVDRTLRFVRSREAKLLVR